MKLISIVLKVDDRIDYWIAKKIAQKALDDATEIVLVQLGLTIKEDEK